MAVGVGRGMARCITDPTVLCGTLPCEHTATEDVGRMRKGYIRKTRKCDDFCCECGIPRGISTNGWFYKMHTYDEATKIHGYTVYWLCPSCGAKSMDTISQMRKDAEKEYGSLLSRIEDKDSYVYNLIKNIQEGRNDRDRLQQ